MNITINLSTANLEIVNSNIISKLYNLISGNSLHNVTLSGNLYSTKGYKLLIDTLVDRFSPNLIITVPVEGQYLIFEDPLVENILKNIIGDGVGITVSDATNANLGTIFKNNTTITSFNEFPYFTQANTNPPAELFRGCTNLEQVNLSNVIRTSNYEFSSTGITEVNAPLLQELGTSSFSSSKIENIIDLGLVTEIPLGCFASCPNLVSAIIPETITLIGNDAFSAYNTNYSKVFTTITGLNNVTSFGSRCFCSLSNLNLNASDIRSAGIIRSQAFSDANLFSGDLNLKSLLVLEGNTFRNTKISKILSLGKITAIPSYAFVSDNANSNLTEAYIPYECLSIESYAFYNKTGLTTIKQYTDSVDDWIEGETPTYTDISRVTTFGSNCFQNCSLLQLSASVLTNATSIGKEAFRNCTLLTGELNLPNLISLGLEAFRDTGITSITDLGTITEIPVSCFYSCASLATISLPQSVITIRGQAFRSCSLLTTFDFSNIISIEGSAFWNSGLTGELNIPNLIGTIGICTFKDTSITSITNLGSITAISPTARDGYNEGAFTNCTSLTAITLPSTLTTIVCGFSGCTSLTTVNGNLLNLTTIGNGSFGSTKISLIPNMTGVQNIGRDSFMKCGLLSIAVNCPNLTSLGNRAFRESGITSVVNLGSITSIPLDCFNGCTSLTSVTLPSTCLTINGGAFGNCPSLTTLNAQNVKTIDGLYSLGSVAVSNLALPAIETIGVRSLSGTHIGVLDLGPNLSSIGVLAFWDSTYSTFIFRGTTVPSFNNVSVDKFLYDMSNVTIYVPESALNDYKTAWPAMASNIVKIEGSVYDTQ